MTTAFIILAIVVITALAFDFTNGFHDTANAMATSIATGALKPFTAVLISAILNVVGAFLSVNVAATVASGIVDLSSYDLNNEADGIGLLTVVFTALIGAILWNLFTWLLGLPSSSSHALFGGMIGAAFAAMGSAGVEWSSIMGKIVIPAVASPIIAALCSAVGTFLTYWITNTIPEERKNEHFRHGQVVTACLVSLAHGAGDAQKTMGVIFLALIATGETSADAHIPFWVILACALSIGLGTVSGGWRVIRTLGKGLVEIESPQGMAAEASSAAIILTSAAGGMALSTTHVSTGSILGTGLGRRGAEVRWGVAMRMVAAWLITLPCSALVGFATWWVAHLFGSSKPLLGIGVDVLILLAFVAVILMRARRTPVNANNVNDEWEHDSENLDSSIHGASSAVPASKKLQAEQAEAEGQTEGGGVAVATETREEHLAELRAERDELRQRLAEVEDRLDEEYFAHKQDNN